MKICLCIQYPVKWAAQIMNEGYYYQYFQWKEVDCSGLANDKNSFWFENTNAPSTRIGCFVHVNSIFQYSAIAESQLALKCIKQEPSVVAINQHFTCESILIYFEAVQSEKTLVSYHYSSAGAVLYKRWSSSCTNAKRTSMRDVKTYGYCSFSWCSDRLRRRSLCTWLYFPWAVLRTKVQQSCV